MPARNMLPILYPKKNPNDLSDMLNDLVQIYVKGLGSAPSSASIQKAIDDQWSACNLITDAGQKRECAKKALDLENQNTEVISKERDLGAVDIEKAINKKLSDAEYYFADDPFTYAEATRGLYRKAFEEMNSILDSIPQRDYKNYTDMDRFEKLLVAYQEKAEDLAIVSNAMKSQNTETLKYYGVFYNTSPNGVTKMEISNTAKQPTGAKPILNLKTKEGLPVYIIDPKPLDDTAMKRAVFGDKNLTYVKVRTGFQMSEPQTFSWDTIKKRAVSTVGWGDFIQDSGGVKYFSTKEGKLAPVSEDVFKMLGGNENKILKMTSWEEDNDLPKLKTDPIKPPSQKIERLIEEASFAEYEAEKAKRTPLLRIFGMKGLFRERPGVMPTIEEIRARTRAKYGIERILPPKETEAVGERAEQIIKGVFK